MSYEGVMRKIGILFGTTLFVAAMVLYSALTIDIGIAFTAMMGGMFGGIVIMLALFLIPGSIQVPFLHSSGPIGIGLTLFILAVAALNLVLDFNFIENGIKQRTPKVGEWWGAFGLLVTVIWIYVEMLRLLSKVRSNMN